MSSKLSRRALASYVAESYRKNGSFGKALDEVAAYLIESRRTREAPLIVRDVETILAEHGTTIATVVSARGLDDQVRSAVTELIGNGDVVLRETVDESLIGGVVIETPTAKLDASIRHKLAQLQTAKLS